MAEAIRKDASESAPKLKESFPIRLGKIDYLGVKIGDADCDEKQYPPLTQQDYIQVSIPDIYISKYNRGWWGVTDKNDIFFTLSIDNGDGVLRVFKTDIIPKQAAGRFVPIFNAIVLPVEILKGNHLTVKVEGYMVYDKDKAALQSSSEKLLGIVSPLVPTGYSTAMGLALSTFNSVLALKSNDQIFNFTITFDVLTNKEAADLYQKRVNVNKEQTPQLLLRPIKYPVINTNESFPLTMNKKDIRRVCEGDKSDLFQTRINSDYDRKCVPDGSDEQLALKGDLLYFGCTKGRDQPVIDHNYIIIQITPWFRDFSNEKFYENIKKIREQKDTIDGKQVASMINESRKLLLESTSYNVLTKVSFEFFLDELKSYYDIKELRDKISKGDTAEVCAKYTAKNPQENKPSFCAKDNKNCDLYKSELIENYLGIGSQLFSFSDCELEEGGTTGMNSKEKASSDDCKKRADLGMINKYGKKYEDLYGPITIAPKKAVGQINYEEIGISIGDENMEWLVEIFDQLKKWVYEHPSLWDKKNDAAAPK